LRHRGQPWTPGQTQFHCARRILLPHALNASYVTTMCRT
jgi:hypothetical protein